MKSNHCCGALLFQVLFVTHSLCLCLRFFDNFWTFSFTSQIRFFASSFQLFCTMFVVMPVVGRNLFSVNSNTFVNIWLELLIFHLRTPLHFRVLRIDNVQARAGRTLSFSLTILQWECIDSDPHLEILLLNFPIYQLKTFPDHVKWIIEVSGRLLTYRTCSSDDRHGREFRQEVRHTFGSRVNYLTETRVGRKFVQRVAKSLISGRRNWATFHRCEKFNVVGSCTSTLIEPMNSTAEKVNARKITRRTRRMNEEKGEVKKKRN